LALFCEKECGGVSPLSRGARYHGSGRMREYGTNVKYFHGFEIQTVIPGKSSQSTMPTKKRESAKSKGTP
jgi:hypothetical protein